MVNKFKEANIKWVARADADRPDGRQRSAAAAAGPSYLGEQKKEWSSAAGWGILLLI